MNRYGRGGRKFLSTIFSLLCIGALSYAGYFLYKKNILFELQLKELIREKQDAERAVKVVPTIVRSAATPATTWMDVQLQVKNTVVKIVSDIAAFNWIEPYKTPSVSRASGSGFFINSDGDIVTNYHVVSQARQLQIEIPALGTERLLVEVVGVCPERDIALLRLAERSKKKILSELGKIPFLKFGNSDEVRRGQDVLALGFPLGVKALKSTQGIVSGRERIDLIKQSCIQTTAPLNPGNSGGPAIDSSGEIIGINFAGVVQAQNVGYIIPINDVKSAIKDMYKIKLLRRPILGCLLARANEDMLQFLGNPQPGGFYVAKVYKNMMLEKVGVQAGDMIYEVNGYKVDRYGHATVPWNEDKVSVMDVLDRLEVGDKVYMDIYRRGKRKEVEFTLEPRFILPVRFIYPDFEKIDYETIGGMVVMELAQNHVPLLAEQSHGLISYELPEKQYDPSLIVSYVQPTSIVSKLRLIAPGSILEEVNGEKVDSLEDFRRAIRKSKMSRFLTIKTQQHLVGVFSVDNIVEDEDRLAAIYQSKKSALIDEIA